jgi:hypothetical protein
MDFGSMLFRKWILTSCICASFSSRIIPKEVSYENNRNGLFSVLNFYSCLNRRSQSTKVREDTVTLGYTNRRQYSFRNFGTAKVS